MIAYTMVVDAYARCYNSNKAMELLNKVRDLEKKGDEKASLTVRFMSSVVCALGNEMRHDVHAARNAVALLDEVIDRYNSNNHPASMPTIFLFNNVLKCCASVNGVDGERTQAFDLAMEVYGKMKPFRRVTPDSYTYNYLLKATTRFVSMRSDRDAKIRAIFEDCAKGGLVNSHIMDRVRRHASPILVDNILNGATSLKALPMEWTINARTTKKNNPRNSRRTNSSGLTP